MPKQCTNGCSRRARRRGLCQVCLDSAGPVRLASADAALLVRMDRKLRAALRRGADLEGCTDAEYVRRAVHERLLRQGAANPGKLSALLGDQ